MGAFSLLSSSQRVHGHQEEVQVPVLQLLGHAPVHPEETHAIPHGRAALPLRDLRQEVHPPGAHEAAHLGKGCQDLPLAPPAAGSTLWPGRPVASIILLLRTCPGFNFLGGLGACRHVSPHPFPWNSSVESGYSLANGIFRCWGPNAVSFWQ